MESTAFWQLSEIPDALLRSSLADLLTAGYRTEARIIAHLAEVEQRKLHLKDGSESLYDYCTRVLRLSNSEAFHRITAARVARQFPIVFGLIEQRQLHLTAVCLLRDYLTPENHQQLFAEASHKTKWQIAELLAHRFPRREIESRIRKLPAPRIGKGAFVTAPSTEQSSLAASSVPEAGEPSGLDERAMAPLAIAQPASVGHAGSVGQPSSIAQGASFAQPASAGQPAVSPVAANGSRRAGPVLAGIQPLSEARYRIQLNASAALKEKLDRLRVHMSHANPNGDLAVVIERALDLALEQVEKRRFAKTDRPRKVRPQPSRAKSNGGQPERGVTPEASNGAPRQRQHVPNAVLREIVARDGMRCSYRAADGCRCTARAFLQVHHDRPWARGGEETVENLRLLCASHNRLLAERDFGRKYVELRRNEARRKAERNRAVERTREGAAHGRHPPD